jgi:hypothetical protein
MLNEIINQMCVFSNLRQMALGGSGIQGFCGNTKLTKKRDEGGIKNQKLRDVIYGQPLNTILCRKPFIVIQIVGFFTCRCSYKTKYFISKSL